MGAAQSLNGKRSGRRRSNSGGGGGEQTTNRRASRLWASVDIDTLLKRHRDLPNDNYRPLPNFNNQVAPDLVIHEPPSPQDKFSIRPPVSPSSTIGKVSIAKPLPALPPPSPLPFELWQLIIRQATLVPDAFDLSLKLSHDDSFQERHRDALAVKLALSSVNRTWRNITLEFLFEIVVISVHSLAERVAKVDTLASLHGPESHLRFVRRLELDSVFKTRRGVNSLSYEPLARLFPLLSNLFIFNFIPPSHPRSVQIDRPASVFSSLFEHCAHSLKSLTFTGANLPYNFAHLLSTTTSRLECLRVYSGNSPTVDLPDDEDEDIVITIPTLRSLLVDDDLLMGHYRWDVPRLEHFSFSRGNPCTFLIPSDPTDQQQTNSLRTLDMPRCYCSSVQPVLDQYPSLETLRIGFRSATSWSHLHGTFPHLRRVELLFPWLLPGSSSHQAANIDELKEAIQAFTNAKMFPSLTSIRIGRNQEAIRGLLKSAWRQDMLRKVRSLRVRVEDSEGQLVTLL